jgi:putative membrane protein
LADIQDAAVHGVFRSRYHAGLAYGFTAAWLILAIAPPPGRFRWFLGNILVFAAVVLMVKIYRRLPLSNLSYGLIALFLVLHTYGAYYAYAGAPIGFWLSDVFAVDRNHYDRVIHFLFGLMMYWPFRELVERGMRLPARWVGLVALMFIFSLSAIYEAIEWVAAMVISPEAALLFLGTQGDVFDAQKDHTLASTGGVISYLLAGWLARRGKLPVAS